MKSVDKKMRATKPYVQNLVALEKPFILTLREIIAVCSFYCNFFLTVSINRLQVYLIKQGSLIGEPITL